MVAVTSVAAGSANPPEVVTPRASRRRLRPWRGLILAVAALYFVGPVLAAFWFSIHNSHTGIDFHAYTGFFSAQGFGTAFRMSLLLGLATVLITLILMVPTMLLVHLRYPRARAWVETFSLLPLVIPPVALVVGVRDIISFTGEDRFLGTPVATVMNFLQGNQPWLLSLLYVVMALPFTYRALDAGLRGSSVTTLVEAARNLGASWPVVVWRVVLPTLRTSVLNAGLLAFALVLGEYTMAKILNFSPFPVWLARFGDTDGQLQVGLSLLSLALTWVLLLAIAGVAGRAPGTARFPFRRRTS
jgi:putative spermidine/putrescine transport system permease protein